MNVIRFDVTPSLCNRANGVNEEIATSHDKSSNEAVFFLEAMLTLHAGNVSVAS